MDDPELEGDDETEENVKNRQDQGEGRMMLEPRAES